MSPVWSAVAAILVWGVVLAWMCLRLWVVVRKIPGPSALPIVGNGLIFLRGSEDAFKRLGQLFREYGPVVRLWFGPKLAVFISSASDAQMVLTHPKVINRDHHTNKTLATLLKTSLITAREDVARAHKKLMAQAFHVKVLEIFMEIFGRKADELSESLGDVANGPCVNIKDELSLCTLRTIFETAIGVSLNYTTEQWMEVRDQVDFWANSLYNRMAKPWLMVDWIYALTDNGKKIKKARKVILQACQDAHAMKRELIAASGTSTSDKKKFRSFLDIVTDPSGEAPLTEDEVHEEILTLAVAGMDTTATTMSYVLILLGIHPEYQNKVFQEQEDIFQGSLRPATTEDISKMSILELVIQEALRLFPPLTFFPREIPVDLPISNGFILPAGCSVVICSYNLQRNSAYFVDPDRFWPERWLPENSVGRHPFAFLPFSAGPRSCIGRKYTHMAMKVTLSRVLRQFRFTSDYSMKELERIEVGTTLLSAVGYDVKIYSR